MNAAAQKQEEHLEGSGGMSWQAITAAVAVLSVATAVATWHGSMLVSINSALSEIRADLRTGIKGIEAGALERSEMRKRIDGHETRITVLEQAK